MRERAVRLLVEARNDLRDGKQFYDGIQQGIGRYFWDSLLADIESLQHLAGVHARQYGYFRMLARHFPYAIYYETQAQHVTVMAILPVRRDPKWVTGQLAPRQP